MKTVLIISNITEVTAYNASGDVISGISFDKNSGIVTMTASPTNIKYGYLVDYENLSMDVTIMGTAYDEVNHESGGSSSGCGGCNAGWNIFALSFVLLYLPLLKSNKK